ncbi:type II toxin-antitoxin system prevent-host-death family antitoxin [Leptolyngbya sp. 15MV]|nr:type II toxin-antitoxin system prevent-host-death family antitoxin [Leptolyngbya sp. 15MV]
MEKTISATEANQRFSEMLRSVAAGESFTVTSRGKPIARVTPIEHEVRREKLRKLLADYETQPVRWIKPWKREDLYE